MTSKPALRSCEATGDSELEGLLRTIAAQFSVALGQAKRVEQACQELESRWAHLASRELTECCALRLVPLLKRRQGPVAQALFSYLEHRVADARDPEALLQGLLEARDRTLQRRSLDLVFDLEREGRVRISLPLVHRVARLLEAEDSSLRDHNTLQRTGKLLRQLPVGDLPGVSDDPAERLLLPGTPPVLRYLAASVLDLEQREIPTDRLVRMLGSDVARILQPYLGYTCASHRDLVDLTPTAGSPPILPSLVAAEKILGQRLLALVLAELGWVSVAWGLLVERLIGVSVGGSFPFAIRPSEASLLESCGESCRLWDRFLITAHGGKGEEPETVDQDLAAVQRFRRYNLAHAEVLSEILAVEPMTVAQARTIVEQMDRIVEDFVALFSSQTEGEDRIQQLYLPLKQRVLAALGDSKADAMAPPEADRLVKMFEDPQSLDEIRTLHGLKRYLHQQGLRQAFRLFRSARATNRTVTLAVASPEKVLRVVRKMRYIDFEPDPGASPTAIGFTAALAAEEIGRHVLHGRKDLPTVEILSYGNEVQVFISFRNHPAFLRLDVSPPLQGGMIDLEYFGVSQYEMDHHPTLTLDGIQLFFRRLDFNVEEDTFHLHVTYDKERCFELGELTGRARALFRMLPYLMDLDWIIGTLAYPETVRQAVAEAWSDFLNRWGVLPLERMLTADRRRVLGRVEAKNHARGEAVWDGRGAYEGCFSNTPPKDLPDRLAAVLEARGLGHLVRWEQMGGAAAQLALETAVLEPLRKAVARGELLEGAEGLRLESAERFRREHEGERLAQILDEGKERLAAATRLADIVSSVERHLHFRTTGSISGFPVQQATLHLRGAPMELFVLRDDRGMARVAVAAAEGGLFRRRPDRQAPWSLYGELEAGEVLHKLRRDRYLTRGYESSSAGADPQEDLCNLFLTPNPNPPPRTLPGDRWVHGIPAAPGRSSGFVRLGTADRAPEELSGAILVAPEIRPEDAPLLRHAAGIVSTGGGILSHAGLIALELQKPALIISGRWHRDSERCATLLYRRLEFREEERQLGPYRLMLRHEIREREEVLSENDLVVLDAEMGTLAVLGQDRDALALYQELREVRQVGEELGRISDDAQILAVRGRLLRAFHQLERVLGRIDRPALARYAVRELLIREDGLQSSADRAGRGRLLQTLCSNPRCHLIAREAIVHELEGMRQRHLTLSREAHTAILSSPSLFEILYLRLGALRLRRALGEVAELPEASDLLAQVGIDEAPSLDGPALERLEMLHHHLSRDMETAGRSPNTRWRLRHLLRQVSQLDRVLPPSWHAKAGTPQPDLEQELASSDAASLASLSTKRVLAPEDGGVELRPLIGSKAANLSEVARIVGRERIPEWFVVTDKAFREVLQSHVASEKFHSRRSRSSRATLSEEIERELCTKETEAAEKAARIRDLWQGVRIPSVVVEEILQAYRSLAPGQAAASPTGDPPDPFVAIRSSAREEDTEDSAWAGQFDTFLFVRGAQALLEFLKLAWAGLWTERALHRRQLLGTSESLSGGGILVQRIVNSRVSGVIHTICLATGELRQMVINAGLGLGEGVVSGIVEVDQIFVAKDRDMDERSLRVRYLVGDKREQVVFDAARGMGTRRQETLYHQRLRPALEYSEICELTQAALELESVFGQPLDIEFAYEGHEMRILQARPVPVSQSVLRETAESFPLSPAAAAAKEATSHDSTR